MDSTNDPWKLLGVGLATLLVVVAAALGSIGIVAIAQHSNSSYDTCLQVNALRIAVTQVLHQSAKGLPSNPYFKGRPDLLKQAEKEVTYDLSLFKPVQC